MKLVLETCPLLGKPCKHVSVEYATHPFTKITKDKFTGLFKPVGSGNKKVELGEFCNDAGKFISDMCFCPVRYDQTKGGADYGLMKKPVLKVKVEVKKKVNKKIKILTNKKLIKKITRKKK